MIRIKKYIKRTIVILLIIVALAAIAFKLYTMNYYRADTKTIKEIERAGDVVVKKYDKNTLAFFPKDVTPKAGIVFYPGGKVEYKAYSGFMYKLAERGYLCLLPRMPENLAFLRLDAASNLDLDETKVEKWYIGGHSLGWVAAGQYLSDEYSDGETKFSGLILCASYVTSDLTDSELSTLSIYGSNDGVLNMEKYRENKKNLPDLIEKVIKGGIHSYFGCYGKQSGDGKSKISNEEQLNEAADIVSEWIEKNRK